MVSNGPRFRTIRRFHGRAYRHRRLHPGNGTACVAPCHQRKSGHSAFLSLITPDPKNAPPKKFAIDLRPLGVLGRLGHVRVCAFGSAARARMRMSTSRRNIRAQREPRSFQRLSDFSEEGVAAKGRGSYYCKLRSQCIVDKNTPPGQSCLASWRPSLGEHPVLRRSVWNRRLLW